MNEIRNVDALRIGIGDAKPPKGPEGGGNGTRADFEKELAEAGKEHDIKFSKHAASRLQFRNVELGKSELDRLGSAVERAGKKGANESLVLLDELALIVSIKNRTVITAMSSANAKEGVFTKIDSAVIA